MSAVDTFGSVVRLLFVHLANTPLYIALIVGIVIALRQRAAYPASTRLALFGFVLALFGILVFTTINTFLPLWLFSSGVSTGNLGMYLSAVGFVGVLVQTVAWGCVVAALSRAWQSGQGRGNPTYDRSVE